MEHPDRRLQGGVGRQFACVRVVADAQARLVLLELSHGVGPLDGVVVVAAEEGHG